MAVLIVTVVEKRGGGAEFDTADFVESEFCGILFFTKTVDVYFVGDFLHNGLGFLAGVTDEVFAALGKIGI